MTEGINVWVMMIKSLGMLCVVLGVLIGVLYALKKFTQATGRAGDKGVIRMISAFYLTPKERVVLMEVMGRKILIGVTPQGITRITEFEGDMDDEPAESHSSDNPMFKGILSRMTGELMRNNTNALNETTNV